MPLASWIELNETCLSRSGGIAHKDEKWEAALSASSRGPFNIFPHASCLLHFKPPLLPLLPTRTMRHHFTFVRRPEQTHSYLVRLTAILPVMCVGVVFAHAHTHTCTNAQNTQPHYTRVGSFRVCFSLCFVCGGIVCDRHRGFFRRTFQALFLVSN